MGFSFRRSSSFGPFRLNFSKSGIGASVGVKGARLTLSPKGTTYITVARGGFYYRQNLSSGSHSHSHVPATRIAEPQSQAGEVRTADVEELLQSSKGELVESLNKRAQMFNPALIIFALAAICAAIGLFTISGAPSDTQATLPDLSLSTEIPRQANRIDEYALLLARHGQPSTIAVTQAGLVPLRTVTYEGAHLAVAFVPVGCFDAYVYHEAHKNDVAPARVVKRHHRTSQTPDVNPPLCVPSTNNASTIVSYRDVTSGSAIDAETAERYLTGLNVKSDALPIAKTDDKVPVNKHEQKAKPEVTNIGYNEETLKGERQRLANSEVSRRKDVKIAAEFLAVALLLLIPGVLSNRSNREKRTTRLVYELTGAASAQQSVLDGALEQLTTSKAIWRIDSQSAIADWKRNAGAAYNVKREQINIRRELPPRIKSNVVPVCLALGKLKLFFLPDQVLYWQRGTFASVEYNDLSFQAGSTNFIEEQVQTSDSRQVGSTWRYVRKDGGPDRRFNNNRQLPVMLYGVVTAISSGGLNLLLHTSNIAAASSFANSFRSFQAGRDRWLFDEAGSNGNGANTREKPRIDAHSNTNVTKALHLFDLSEDATSEQLANAYKHMAHLYHPDKVAGLGPELQRLAEEKMKQINVAHELLKSICKPPDLSMLDQISRMTGMIMGRRWVFFWM